MKCLYIKIIIILFFIQVSFAQDLSRLSYAELDSLTYLEEGNNNFKGCIAYVQVAQEKAKAEFGAKDSLYARYTSDLGYFYYQMGAYKKAEPLYILAKNLRAEMYGEMHAEFAGTLQNLASLYRSMGEFEKAEPLFLQSKDIYLKTAGEQSSDFATSLSNLATLYHSMSQYEKAEEYFLKAVEIRGQVLGKDNSDFGNSLNNLGTLYRVMGNYEKAEPIFLQAKNILAKTIGEQHPNFASLLTNLGKLYEEMGQYEKAEEFYIAGKNIWLNVFGESHPNSATGLNNLANFYKSMKDYEKAESLLLQSKRIIAKVLGENDLFFATSLNNLGALYLAMEQYNKSELLFLQSEKILAKILGKEHPTYAGTLSNLASLYRRMGKLDLALNYCLRSLDANSAEMDSSFYSKEISTLNWSALDQFECYSNEHISKIINVLLEVFQAKYEKTNDRVALEIHYKIVQVAMRLNEHTRNNFSGEADKLRLLSSNTIFVREGIKTALLLGKEIHQQEAFGFAELNKSILLADAVKGNRARTLGDLPDTLVAKEIALQKELTDLKKKQYEAKTPEAKEKSNKALLDLNLEIDQFLKSIKNKYPKYHALKYENITAKVSDIQSLIDDKTALLEYFLTDSVAYLFVITKTTITLHPIPVLLEDLKKQIKTLRLTLSNYNYVVKAAEEAYHHYTEAAHWFYKNFLAPGIEGKKLENLIIVTDGELGHLPFETFLVQPANEQEVDYKNLPYLVKYYNISYNYSATLFANNQSNTPLVNNGKMLACAAQYPSLSAWNKGKEEHLAALRVPYFVNLRKLLQPLPAAQKEIAVLAENFQGDFLWNDSTNERFFKENAQHYGIIHLAMHGILEQKQPMLSSLAFTENHDSVEDNFLQAFEIAHLKLNADLVVLSACETGYGKFEQGEGVVSLARSFMYAGVPSLVVSLWQVNDHSTAEIMKLFYENLANGMTKDAALRQAKLNYLKSANDVTAHPAFWSPFIQLGDSKAIYLKKKSGWFWWLVGAGVITLAGGVFAMSRKKS